MVLNSYGIPLTKIKKGLREFTFTPAYIKASVIGTETEFQQNPNDKISSRDTTSSFTYISYQENESKGFGGILSYFHALGNKLGYAINFSHIRLSGTQFALAEYGADGSPSLEKKHFVDEEGDSTQLMAYMVYDHFAATEKSFNIPLFFGFGLYDSVQEANGSFSINTSVHSNDTVTYNATIDTVSFGFILGGAFQFDTGDFRWSPFLLAFFPLDTPEYVVQASTATGTILTSEVRTETEGDTFLPSGGIAVSYMPWGLTFRWTPNLFNLFESHEDIEFKQSVLTLSKTWTWFD